MAVAKRCDRCKKYYEARPDNVYMHENENGETFAVNSIRIGNWNQKTKSWNSLASAYDLCADCAREICEAVFAKGEMQMKAIKHIDVRKNKKKEPGEVGEVVATAEPEAAEEVTEVEANGETE